MQTITEYSPTAEKHRKLANLHPWDILLTGDNNEYRCTHTIKQLKQHMQPFQYIQLSREKNQGGNGQFILKSIDCPNKYEEKCSAQLLNLKLTTLIENCSQKSTNIHILMDITSLELDAILHIQHICQQEKYRLFALYTSPAKYKERKKFKLQLNTIAQPPGYTSLTVNSTSPIPHIIILGFDSGRAERFLTQYPQWQFEDIFAIYSSPAYIKDGERMALNANSWIDSIPEKQRLSIDGLNPSGVYQQLQKIYTEKKRMDIVPLGPKLMLLGITEFYFSLPKNEQKNIRILYDFPQPTPGSTTGIKKHYLLEC
jgi:hypothetical protein